MDPGSQDKPVRKRSRPIMRASERSMACALARWINVRKNLVVPNVSWGLVMFGEMDLISVSAADYVTEYEIKTSIPDLKREWTKKRWTRQRHRMEFEGIIKRYFICVPLELVEKAKPLIPRDVGAGLLSIDNNSRVLQVMPARGNRARKITNAERYKIARLGVLRYWSHVT